MNQIAHHHAMTNILQLTICPLFSSKKIQLSCIIYDHAKNMKVPMVAMAREDTKLQKVKRRRLPIEDCIHKDLVWIALYGIIQCSSGMTGEHTSWL